MRSRPISERCDRCPIGRIAEPRRFDVGGTATASGASIDDEPAT